MLKRVAKATQQNGTTASFNTQLLALAPTLFAQYGCVVIDFAGDARMDNPSDLTYRNADGVHTNGAGALILAQIADAALAAYK